MKAMKCPLSIPRTGQVVVRGNVVRNLENAVDTTPNSYRIALDGCENAIVEANIVNIDSFPAIIHHTTCGQVKYFNNQTPGGQLVQGYLNLFLPVPPQYVNELATDANLAASLLT